MYASFLGISEALHLGIFHQPPILIVLRQAPKSPSHLERMVVGLLDRRLDGCEVMIIGSLARIKVEN
jgi:hypothetical protein